MLVVTFQFFCRLFISFSKFGFAIFLSKEAPLEVLGQYGLIAGFSIILVQLAGLELHYVNVRRILGSNNNPWPAITNQLRFNACSHTIIALFTVGICVFLKLQWSLIPLVVILVFAEHMSQEAYRFLVALHRPGFATLVLMLKSAGWMLIYILLVYVKAININIVSILVFWSTSALLGLAVLIVASLKKGSWEIWLHSIDFYDIRKLIGASWPFLIMASAYALAQSLDRMIIYSTHGAALTGIYFFFLSLASGVYTLVSYPAALLFQPRAVQAFLQDNQVEFRRQKRHILLSYVVLGTLAIAALIVLLPWILEKIGKTEYLDQTTLFWVLLTAQVLLLSSDFALIDVYAKKLDRASMIITIISLGVYIGMLAFVPSKSELIGVALCLTGFYATLWALRIVIRFLPTKNPDLSNQNQF